jgi:hypothetical protein
MLSAAVKSIVVRIVMLRVVMLSVNELIVIIQGIGMLSVANVNAI